MPHEECCTPSSTCTGLTYLWGRVHIWEDNFDINQGILQDDPGGQTHISKVIRHCPN